MGQSASMSNSLASRLHNQNVHIEWMEDFAIPSPFKPKPRICYIKFETYEPETTSCVEEGKKTAIFFELGRCRVTLNEDATVAELFKALQAGKCKPPTLELFSRDSRLHLSDEQPIIPALKKDSALVLRTGTLTSILLGARGRE